MSTSAHPLSPMYDTYWSMVNGSYAHYPTIRHRKRFVLSQIAKRSDTATLRVFDLGCGDGALLAAVQQEFSVDPSRIGGSDISEIALSKAKKAVDGAHWYLGADPAVSERFDVIICSEVIEHTTEYAALLRWAYDHLAPGGELILTTQAGRIHASDRYTGHTQHFTLRQLTRLLTSIGYRVRRSVLWGFPFFMLQKYLTNLNFDQIKQYYLEGGMSLRKRLTFGAAYTVYHLHDCIPFGSQIYIVARRDA
jgi:SAM-dependent methyltransferase